MQNGSYIYFYPASLVAIGCLALGLSPNAQARSPRQARVTQASGNVELTDTAAGARPITINDSVSEGTVLQTGADSAAELTFPDETVVRLAANTAFSFKRGTRDLQLEHGAVLIEAPKRARGATIHASKVSAAIKATTVMLEFHPGVCKFLVLEGTGRLFRPGHLGDSVLVWPGQLVIGDPNAALSDPVDFDIDRFVRTSHFLVNLPPLASEKLIARESQKQEREKSKKTLIDTNLVIFGGGTLVSLVDPARVDTGDVRPVESSSPTPTPSPSLTVDAAEK